MSKDKKKNIFISREDIRLLKRAFTYVKPHIFLFISTFIVIITGIVVELFQPYIYGMVIDYILDKNLQLVWRSLLFIFALIIGNGLISLLETYLSDLLGNKIILDIKQDLYGHILNLPVKVYDELRVGELISRLEGDVDALSNIITFQSMRVVLDVVRIFGIGFIIFRYSATLSWIIVLAFPITYLVMGIFGKVLRCKNKEMRALNDQYYSFLTESFGGVREIKALNIETRIKDKFMTWARQIFHKRINIDLISALSSLSTMWLNGVTGLIVMGVGGYFIIAGTLTMGTYVAFNNYSSQFNRALGRIAQLNVNIQQAMVSLERIFALIDNFMLPPEKREGLIPGSIEGKICFKKVSFQYEENKPVLKDISFIVPPNQMTALVGASGSGKTTLLNLVMRFYSPDEGEVFLDSYSFNQLHLDYLRDQMTIVSQEPFLFNMSIKENLLLAKNDATMDEIIVATKKAYIHQFIITLPKGYDTIIRERGARLSGGQKQRLSIARAILKGSKILLFDEPTSALDGEADEYIQNVLHELLSDHTIIVIAHSLSMVINADQIVVLSDGHVVGVGKHDDMIENNLQYQRLYQSQWNRIQENSVFI